MYTFHSGHRVPWSPSSILGMEESNLNFSFPSEEKDLRKLRKSKLRYYMIPYNVSVCIICARMVLQLQLTMIWFQKKKLFVVHLHLILLVLAKKLKMVRNKFVLITRDN